MRNQLPGTSAPPAVMPPAPQLALEAYWLLRRHAGVYAGQVLALAAVCWLALIVVGIVFDLGTAHASIEFRIVFLQATYIAAFVAVLVLGGTAIFISCQRAIVLDRPPAVRDALRLRPSDRRVLRGVCVYWLVVHLVPTVVVNGAYIAQALGLPFLQMPKAVAFAFYWGWVLATAPLVVLSLPITLFEAAADPLAEGRRRLDGNIGRMVVASALAFAPIAIVDIALELLQDAYASADEGTRLLLDVLAMPLLQAASSLATILVMSALVAAVYLRLSPRLDSVYRVFD
ncbi:MAG: hypothetical protein AB7S71_22390 [Dongiaceae bacterium]